VKVLKGPIYETRLAEFASTFMNHQREIEFTLLLHTSLGLDSTVRTISDFHATVRSTDEKLKMILLFRRLDSPNETELMKYVESKGGAQKCIEDDMVLQQLDFMRQTPGVVPVSEPVGTDGIQNFSSPHLVYSTSTPHSSQPVYQLSGAAYMQPLYTSSMDAGAEPAYQPQPVHSAHNGRKRGTRSQSIHRHVAPIYDTPRRSYSHQVHSAPSYYASRNSSLAPYPQHAVSEALPHLKTKYSSHGLRPVPSYPANSAHVASETYPQPNTLHSSYQVYPYARSPSYSSVSSLSDVLPAKSSIHQFNYHGQPSLEPPSEIIELKKELDEDVDETLQKNMIAFERKLQVQKQQLVQLEIVVRRQGDRVITAMGSGPHDGLLDPVSFFVFYIPINSFTFVQDMSVIWKENVRVFRCYMALTFVVKS
jgi:hypothetical protein